MINRPARWCCDRLLGGTIDRSDFPFAVSFVEPYIAIAKQKAAPSHWGTVRLIGENGLYPLFRKHFIKWLAQGIASSGSVLKFTVNILVKAAGIFIGDQ